MTEEQTAILEALEATANDPALYLDMEFRPGDIQLLKNSVILHKRTEYEDWEEPERKRHLLRLWLAAPDFDDGDEQLRRGIALA
jgi:alpha-ketoglutarate-dependent taurine dioxygenase